jgi:hypothetical protein
MPSVLRIVANNSMIGIEAGPARASHWRFTAELPIQRQSIPPSNNHSNADSSKSLRVTFVIVAIIRNKLKQVAMLRQRPGHRYIAVSIPWQILADIDEARQRLGRQLGMELLREGLDATEKYGNHGPVRNKAMQLEAGAGQGLVTGGVRSEMSDEREAGEEVKPHGRYSAMGRGVGRDAFPVVEFRQDVLAGVQTEVFWVGDGSVNLEIEMRQWAEE